MFESSWHSFMFGIVPSALVTIVFLILLGVLVRRRRRLGAAAKFAVAGFALLSGAGLAGLAWEIGELAFDLSPDDVVEAVFDSLLNAVWLAGLAAVCFAVFAGRTRT